MSRTARARRRRIQPYAWLGTGAVTLGLGMGLGVGLVSGAGVAFADTATASTDTASATASATASEAAPESPAAGPSAKSAATRGGRGPVTSPVSDTAVQNPLISRIPAPAAAVDSTDALLARTAPVTATPRGSAARRTPRTAAVVQAPAIDPAVESDGTGSDTAPAAAVPGPAADPAPNMESWLPTTPIVPGEHVALALQEMTQAGMALQAGTWGAGNVLAGLASLVPQVFLAGAALSLSLWQTTNPGAQGFLAATAGIPVVAQIAQANLVVNTWLTGISQVSLGGAALFLPLVGLLGAPAAVAATEPLIAAARSNGMVYAVVPLQVRASTQPVASVSVNNGSAVPLLVDTGASGIVVLPTAVPNVETLTPVGSGNSCFSGGLCYHYETYEVPIDFGGGAATGAGLVNVVTDSTEYPESVADFTDYFSWGADGIMGVGANTAGPGPAPIPNATLPGELSDGLLIFQPLLPFGLGGVLVFGPNPLPTRVSLPGAPDAYVKVSVDGGTTKTDAGAIIDSGGVYGTLPLDNAPAGSVVGQDVTPGTVISVYSPDGATLLYTFTALSGERGTPVIPGGLMNTGNAPFAQQPIYMNYAGPGGGIGSTDFSIW